MVDSGLWQAAVSWAGMTVLEYINIAWSDGPRLLEGSGEFLCHEGQLVTSIHGQA